jgi:hypothetical protein
MASLDSIKIQNGSVFITLKADLEEYKLLNHSVKDLLLLPSDNNFLSQIMRTGALGNSKRLMLKKKFLKLNEFNLEKDVNSRVFQLNDEVFLLVKLKAKQKKQV